MTRPGDEMQPIGDAVPGWSRRARPRPGPFLGGSGSVVPLEAAHADDLFATCAGPGNEALWTYLADGPYLDRAAFDRRLAEQVADPASVSVSVLDRSGRPAGIACYLRIDEANGSVEVGNILLGRSLQRTRTDTEAMHLMARHVFEDLGYRRYEWKCDALNAPSRAAALRLGFHHEGTFRQAVVYKGRSRDTAWFSITDGEWPAVAAAHRAWLAPHNFRPDGSQRHSLSVRTRPGQ